ncbi:acyltransferase family protein [Pseudomonas simiae]|uniref:acyltransferase family protein n=1 Tax=Pseudomonas simiae TaxID=321846 RepID=UPI00358EB0B5
MAQPNTLSGVLASGFAANYFNSSFTTIPVLWTLEIEMIFYIVMAFFALVFKRLGYKELIFISILCATFVAAYSFPSQDAKIKPDVFRHFSVIFVHVSYMIIGAIICRAYEAADKLKGVFLCVCQWLFIGRLSIAIGWPHKWVLVVIFHLLAPRLLFSSSACLQVCTVRSLLRFVGLPE